MRLFIILGRDCNLQCTYCCQRQIINQQIPRHISTKFWNYFYSLPPKTRVTFFGGEPLLYFGAIKEIMSHRSDLHYGVITNGKLLDEEKVTYFNTYNVGVTISWDGDISTKTRGYNALRDNPNIKDLNNLGISAVLTKWNSIASVIHGVNKYLPGKNCSLNFDFPLNFTDKDFEYEQLNTSRIYNTMRRVTDRVIHFRSTPCERALLALVQKQVHNSNQIGNKCGNGTTVINIDLEGRLYNCHNENFPADYTKAWDKTIRRQNDMCTHCEIQGICYGGCSLVSDKNTKKQCQNKIAFYEGVVISLLRHYGGV